LSIAAALRAFHLCWLSRPVGQRCVYRSIRRQRATKFVEFGVGDLRRAKRMIAMAGVASPGATIHYAGIDEFELRRAAKLPLKTVWQGLRQTGAKVRLLPGEPFAALARSANDLAGADIVIISADVSRESMERAGTYLPRLLHNGTLVFQETVDGKGKSRLARVELAPVVPPFKTLRRAA